VAFFLATNHTAANSHRLAAAADFLSSHSKSILASSTPAIACHRVGFGDICPGNTGMVGKIFLLLFSFCGLGIFCGPCVQLASSWRHHVPGGLPALGSFTIGLGVTIFMSLEGLDHFESIYASVITGT
jgi:hypothetical protein